MKKISKSPERYTFQKEKFLERTLEQGKTEDDPEVSEMLKYYDQMLIDHDNKELDPKWKENNLEYDLRSTEWICEKVKRDEVYAQNLYAAMCNNDFQKLEVVPILKSEKWHCSWRYAGGILADMREEGDYIDWYCSGIRDSYDGNTNQRNYVSESVVTDEIREDLRQLGWVVVDEDDSEC